MVALHVPVADEEVGLVAGAVGVMLGRYEAEAARARSLAQRAVLLAVPEAYHAAAQFQLQLLQAPPKGGGKRFRCSPPPAPPRGGGKRFRLFS